jgi:hypothetical protein
VLFNFLFCNLGSHDFLRLTRSFNGLPVIQAWEKHVFLLILLKKLCAFSQDKIKSTVL